MIRFGIVISVLISGAAPQALAAPPPIAMTSPPPVLQRTVTQPKDSEPKTYLLKISMKIGEDDLRSDSSAWLMVDLPHGPIRCSLRDQGGETWENRHTYPSTCLLTLWSPQEADNREFVLQYKGQPGDLMVHSWDNWNVDEVRVEVEDLATHRSHCILEAMGSPLVRMTAQNFTKTLLPANYPCP